jgi:hypothetical protein
VPINPTSLVTIPSPSAEGPDLIEHALTNRRNDRVVDIHASAFVMDLVKHPVRDQAGWITAVCLLDSGTRSHVSALPLPVVTSEVDALGDDIGELDRPIAVATLVRVSVVVGTAWGAFRKSEGGIYGTCWNISSARRLNGMACTYYVLPKGSLG